MDYDAPGNLDPWGGMQNSPMAQPPTGDFGIGETGDPPEGEPSEGDGPTASEAPVGEDPMVDTTDEDGNPRDPSEGAAPDPSAMAMMPMPGGDPTGGVPFEDPMDVPTMDAPTTPAGGGSSGTMGYTASVPPETTPGPRGRHAWFLTPSGSPIFLNGVNTVYLADHGIHLGTYLASHSADSEWHRLSDRASYGLNWIGGWEDAGNPVIAAPGSRVPYGVVLSVAAQATGDTLHEMGDPANPVARRFDGQPFSQRGHWLQDPHLPGGHTVLCGGFSRHAYGDPFNPDYQRALEASIARQVAPHRGRANLAVYYLDNEGGLGDWSHGRGASDASYCAGGTGIVDLRRFLWTECPQFASADLPVCAPFALARFLRDRYTTVAALDAAWGAHYADFADVVTDRPVPVDGTRGDDLADFALILARQYVRVATQAVRHADTLDDAGTMVRAHARPVASPRLALSNDRAFHFFSLGALADQWTTGGEVPDPHARPRALGPEGALYPVLDPSRVRFDPYRAFGRLADAPDAGFDLLSVNVYTGAARFPATWLHTGFARLRAVSGRSVMVSEFGLRLRDPCWTNSNGAGSFVGADVAYTANDPRDVIRGQRYASQVRQLVHEGSVAVAWHRWLDDEQAPPPGTRPVPQCGNHPRHQGERKGLLRGDGQRYEGLYHGVHGFNLTLYGNVHSVRSWWQ